jgi:hypothetical protein
MKWMGGTPAWTFWYLDEEAAGVNRQSTLQLGELE